MLARVLLGSFLAAAAAGGKDAVPIRWSSSWQGAFEEAKARNVPVLMVFGKDG